MAQTGITKIDQLFDGQDPTPIGPVDSDQEAVGIIQDFLCVELGDCYLVSCLWSVATDR